MSLKIRFEVFYSPSARTHDPPTQDGNQFGPSLRVNIALGRLVGIGRGDRRAASVVKQPSQEVWNIFKRVAEVSEQKFIVF